jgi:hypothetical protein
MLTKRDSFEDGVNKCSNDQGQLLLGISDGPCLESMGKMDSCIVTGSDFYKAFIAQPLQLPKGIREGPYSS